MGRSTLLAMNDDAMCLVTRVAWFAGKQRRQTQPFTKRLFNRHLRFTPLKYPRPTVSCTTSRLFENVASEGQTRQKQAEKRSLGVLNEHFPPVFNAVWPSAAVFTQSAGNLTENSAMHPAIKPAIQVDRLNKTFARKPALVDLALSIQPGEMVALIGASGSGKSTLLRHLAGLACCDRSNGGSVQVLGREVQAAGRLNGKVRKLRSDIGYIFQQFNLVNRLSVLDNVLLGCLGRMPGWRGNLGLFNSEEKQRALQSLDRVGLVDLAGQRASTLSGGQQQRVAIARALTQRAEVILADEPIASLDPESARKVMEILADINRTDGKTIVVTLHQVDYAVRYCPRAVALKGGRIHFDGDAQNLSSQFLNDLYGADVDTSLMISDEGRRSRETPRLMLARS